MPGDSLDTGEARLSPERLLEKKAKHLPTGIRAAGIGVGTRGTAS